VLELDDLTCDYGAERFSYRLSLARGLCLAVIGPSGAGKSTLLNLIAGFEAATSGRLTIDGREVTAEVPAARPVTMLFQEHNLFAHLTVAQNVGLGLDPGLKLTIADMEALQEALALVGLEGFDTRLPAALSGGQRQRVALARALVRRRPLLLLDEPFSALDPGLRDEMLALVDRLRRDRGLTVVMVSHEVADARRIAERTAFVHDGRILMEDETEQLLARRDSPELKRFLGLYQRALIRTHRPISGDRLT
jgi:thiamine transport system ATP-binding protein